MIMHGEGEQCKKCLHCVMDQLDDIINSIDKDTREGLDFEDIKFLRSLIIDLNSCKNRILEIYYRGIYGGHKNEMRQKV